MLPAAAVELLSETDVVELLRREVEKAGSQTEWARSKEVSGAYVSEVLRGKAPPGEKLAIALGLRRRVVYEKL